VSVIAPSYAIKRRYDSQTGGRRRPQLELRLWLACLFGVTFSRELHGQFEKHGQSKKIYTFWTQMEHNLAKLFAGSTSSFNFFFNQFKLLSYRRHNFLAFLRQSTFFFYLRD